MWRREKSGGCKKNFFKSFKKWGMRTPSPLHLVQSAALIKMVRAFKLMFHLYIEMDDSTTIIGIVITSIVVFVTIVTGVLYYIIVYRHRKQQKQVADDTSISVTTKRMTISTTSF